MEKNSRKQFGSAGVALLLAVIIALLAMPSAWAQGQTMPQPTQPTGPQQVSGTAQELFGAVFGSDLIGAAPSGWTSAGFVGNGMNYATGTARAAGSGSGGFYFAPGWASSSAASSGMSYVDVTGNLRDTATVAGAVDQANWAGVVGPDQYNFVNAGNATVGGYDGTASGRGSLVAVGGAGADGTTWGSLSQGVNSAQAQVFTQGESSAVMNVPGATTASGNGLAEAGSMVGVPGSGGPFAGGDVTGAANHKGTGGQNASGSLVISGNTNGAIGVQSVSANAGITVTAAGTGPALPTPPIGSGPGRGGH